MSELAEPEQRQFCPRFSGGRFCSRGRNCPLIHKWALFHSARTQRAIVKRSQNQGDAGNKTCTQEHANTSVDMRHSENINLGDSGKGMLVNTQGAAVARKLPAVPEKSQQPVKDGQSSKPRMFRGKNRGKMITETVGHENASDPSDNIRKTVKTIPSFKLNESLPSRSPSQYVDGQITKGKAFSSRSLLGSVNQGVSGNMTAPFVKNQQARSRWPKAPKHNGGYASISRTMISEASNGPYTYHDLTSQYEEVRNARMQFYGYAAQKAPETKDGKTLGIFTLFPELPFEIRLVIWQFVILFPHNPAVRFVPVRDRRGAIVFRDIICNSRAPIALHINRESRKEALKHYTMIFDNTTYLRKTGATLYLDTDAPGDITHFVAAVSGQDLGVIENLAVWLFEWCWMDETFGEAIQEFPNLKRLLMMFTKSDDSPYLSHATYKKINKELKQSAVSRTGWKVPYIGLVQSGMTDAFLKSNTFA